MMFYFEVPVRFSETSQWNISLILGVLRCGVEDNTFIVQHLNYRVGFLTSISPWNVIAARESMDVSSPSLWMCIDISSSVRDEFQMTGLHQSELTVQDSQTLPRAWPLWPGCSWHNESCAQPMSFTVGCAPCFMDRSPGITWENALVWGGDGSSLGKVMLKCIWLEHS